MILTDILEKSAAQYPNSLALTMKMGYRTVNLTYKQVYDLAKQVALFLDDNNIYKGDKVIIFAPNSPYWGIIFWGCLLRGVIAVPVNIQSTSSQIKKIIDQTEPKLIFKSKFLKRDLPESLKSFDIESLDGLVADYDSNDFVKTNVSPDDLVEILYTSGTTGDPKGVELTHKNLTSNTEAISKIFNLKPARDIVLSILPLTHILEQTIGFFVASYYATHIVYAHSYAAILDLMQEYKATKILVVPEFLKVFLSKIKAEAQKQGKLKAFNKLLALSCKLNNKFISRLLFRPVHKNFGGKLDSFISGGAFLDPELEREWNALGFSVLQGYGLTETSPVVTCNTYDEHRFASVGKALSNVEVKLDDIGQVLVKGPNVFKGYFKNEEKTKECFTDAGWFKTGDIGELDKDGFLFLKGRQKYVIIGPGGQNVFPEDIEIELDKIEGVKDSCVLGVPKDTGHIEVHAALLLEDKSLDPEKIIEQANKDLASYQQITGWTVWPKEDFQRSATRKIKKELVLEFIQSKAGQEDLVESETKHSKLVGILSQVSGVSLGKITSESKVIQDLKLDSLMLVELALRIEQDYSRFIDMSLIKPNTTIEQLEEIIKIHKPVVKIKLNKWPRSWWAKAIRVVGQFKVILFYRMFIKIKVQGIENLKDLKFPVIFMPNHTSYVDPLLVAMSLPYSIRKNISFAAAKDVLYGLYKYAAWLADLLFNSFCLPRRNGEGIRFGLDNMGKLLDMGYSVVVFPEGQMSLDGKLLPLKKGTGLMSIEMEVPVIPVKIIGAAEIVPYAKIIPRKRGQIIVKFGKPIKFEKTDSYESARKKIEAALQDL